MSAGSSGNEGGRGCGEKPLPLSVASVSLSSAPVDGTVLLSWAVAEVTISHFCVLAHVLPAVVNASLTLFYLLSPSRTLNARTSSGKLP